MLIKKHTSDPILACKKHFPTSDRFTGAGSGALHEGSFLGQQ